MREVIATSGRRIILVMLLQSLVVWGNELRTYKAEEYCDYAVSRGEPAGIIRFNTTTFSGRKDHSSACQVVVEPKTVKGSGRNGKVLLYFTEFNLTGSCADMSVSLTDGPSRYDTPIAGTPPSLCGTNSTLTRAGMVFNTSGSEFSVLVRWTKYSLETKAAFVLKFSSYYDGPCEDDLEVVTCQNARCTAKAFHCHAEVDTCGGGEEGVCDSKSEDKPFWDSLQDTLLSTVKDIVVVVVVIVFIFLIGRFLQAMKTRNGPIGDFIRKISANFGNRRQPEARVRSRAPSVTTVELNQQTDTSDPLTGQDTDPEQITVTTDDPGNADPSGPAAPPPSYDALSPLPTAPSQPYPPPPTYDDVISDESRYMYKP